MQFNANFLEKEYRNSLKEIPLTDFRISYQKLMRPPN